MVDPGYHHRDRVLWILGSGIYHPFAAYVSEILIKRNKNVQATNANLATTGIGSANVRDPALPPKDQSKMSEATCGHILTPHHA